MRNETPQEKGIRIFNFYKKELEKLSDESRKIRMICIEYACSFPNINAYKMASSLLASGYNIVYDDSSITERENGKKRKNVENWRVK